MIVFTNGCFDILHRGHLELFKYAKSLGDILYVSIDSDRKIKEDKGHLRPFNIEEDRKFILESIRYIDNVFIFDSEKDLERLIKTLNPDIMIVGSDWKGRRIIGAPFAKEVRFFERIDGYSTTKIFKCFSDR